MSTRDRLYELLPAIYRLRDADQGYPLQALLKLLTEELERVETDITGLYKNWFIETCAEWVVPYIGDLLSVRGLHQLEQSAYSQRAWVANTLRYRRRKGTAVILEQIARDVTGWPARVVEFFELLGTTQYLNHLRPQNLQSPDLRDVNALALLNGPFDRIAHTADLRTIRQSEGWYNIPNIGLFLWRLQSYRVLGSTARVIGPGQYTFSPLGLDAPLFTSPDTETEITHLAEEINVPTPIRPGAFYNDLQAYQALPPSNRPAESIYYGPNRSLFIELVGLVSPPGETATSVQCADLSTWFTPPAGMIAVDVRLGRLAFDPALAPDLVRVNYNYGFSGDVGGGPYNRQDSLLASLLANEVTEITWIVGVAQTASPTAFIFASLDAAVTAWNALPPGQTGVIALMDSGSYGAPVVEITLAAGSRLWIVAGTWSETAPYAASTTFLRGTVTASGVLVEEPDNMLARGPLRVEGLRPHLQGDFTVRGTINEPSLLLGELTFNGLLMEGNLTVKAGNLTRLRLDHCTLIEEILVEQIDTDSQRNEELAITLNRSVVGQLNLPETVPLLSITDSILMTDILAPNASVNIQSSTIFGKSTLGNLEASNSIFMDRATVRRAQEGCVRFCYVPEGSRVARRYRCQPQLALDQRAKALNVESLPIQERSLILGRVRPEFTSEIYGQPAYAQLSLGCAEEIRTGAEDGSEMGVFDHLKQPQREANLRVALEEYLRFGLEAGLIFVS